MNILLTAEQAADISYECFREFVRAAFYTGHSLVYIKEMVSSPQFEGERKAVIELALALGMNDADVIRIK